jgi:hypothetical protein
MGVERLSFAIWMQRTSGGDVVVRQRERGERGSCVEKRRCKQAEQSPRLAEVLLESRSLGSGRVSSVLLLFLLNKVVVVLYAAYGCKQARWPFFGRMVRAQSSCSS